MTILIFKIVRTFLANNLLDTGGKLQVHKTFIRRLGPPLSVLYALSLGFSKRGAALMPMFFKVAILKDSKYVRHSVLYY